MDKFVSIKPLDSQLPPGKRVLKAGDYQHLVTHEELLRELSRREHERELKVTEATTRAIQSGVQQGRDQAHQEAVDRLLGFTIRMNESVRDVELALVDVVVEAVQEIVREFDDEILAKNLVRRGLELVRSGKTLSVRVHPQMQSVVMEQLQDWRQAGSPVEVRADEQLKLDECVLESDVGIVNASVEKQVESLIRALRKTFPAPPRRPS